MDGQGLAPMLLANTEERDSVTEGVGLIGQRVPYELAGAISPGTFHYCCR